MEQQVGTYGVIDVTDRNGRKLECHVIHEATDREALRRQGEIQATAQARYKNNCYVFNKWRGSLCYEPPSTVR